MYTSVQFYEYWAYTNGILFPAANEGKDPNENKKTHWNYVKHCKKDSIGVAPLRNPSTGILESEPIGKAELLNEQFKSVFSKITPLCLEHLAEKVVRTLPPCLTPDMVKYPTLPDFTISTNGIKKMLGTLKPNKAAGPDKIHPLALKNWETPWPPYAR